MRGTQATVRRITEATGHDTRCHRIDASHAMRTGMREGNYHIMYEQDYAFHRTLWEIADHSILIEVVSGLRARLSRFLYEAASALPRENANRHVDSHDEMINILKSGDVAAAQAEITQHILAAKERILTYCQVEDVEFPPID